MIKAYLNVNHEVNMANRRSHSDIIIYVNNAPIIWYNKCQNIVDSSIFGSDFLAFRISTNMIEDMMYKLKCFGLLVNFPTEVCFEKVICQEFECTLISSKQET